jgi:hypothetical protein
MGLGKGTMEERDPVVPTFQEPERLSRP